MVMKGQFLERPALVPCGDVVLEGLWHRGHLDPPLLIVPPPPERGGMDHVLAAELAFAAAHAGHPELRFNHRGVGASQGRKGAAASRVTDARAALALLRENTGTERVAVVSVGAGARTALALAAREPALAGVALAGPEELAPKAPSSRGLPLLVVVPREAAALPAGVVEALGARLEVVDGADARFTRGLPQLARAVVGWLGRL